MLQRRHLLPARRCRLSRAICRVQAFGFVAAPHTYVSRKDEGDKLVVLERGDVVMVFNFHPTNSYQDYRVGCLLPGPYKVGAAGSRQCQLSPHQQVPGTAGRLPAAGFPPGGCCRLYVWQLHDCLPCTLALLPVGCGVQLAGASLHSHWASVADP